MFRPGPGSPRQPILPWLLLFLLACGVSSPPETVAIPHPSLEQIDSETREQLAAARQRLEDLEAGTAAQPELAAATGELGRLYQGYGFDEAAMAAYSNAVALAPGEFRWLYYLGALELDRGELQSGGGHLERALHLRPDDAPTLQRLARAALDQAEFDRARDLYARAAEAEPGCAAAHFGIGLAALGSGDHQRAVEAFERTLQLEPGASQTQRPLAMAHRALGHDEQARQSLALAGTAVPTCPDPLMAEIQGLATGASALFERATLTDLEGRSEAALELAQQAVEADGTHAAARRLYGQLLTRNGRIDEAIEQLEAAAELEPADRRTYMLLGRAYRSAGQLDTSVQALAQAVELDPTLFAGQDRAGPVTDGAGSLGRCQGDPGRRAGDRSRRPRSASPTRPHPGGDG